MRRLLDFVNPRLKAGRVPWGRTAIVAQIIGAAIFVGYTLAKKNIDLPFSSSKYEVEVIFPDAKGLDPADGPSAAVAGSPVGKVTKVEYVDGRARVTLELDSDVKGKIFADATAALRPASALQNLLVNVDPGTPDAGALPDDQPIEPQNTSAFVSIDELTSIFDADTQAYTQILIGEAQRALHGRAPELRASLAQLGDLVNTAKPVSEALADRRQLLAQLVGSLDTVFAEVSKRGDQLGAAIDAGSRTLAVTSDRSAELESATRNLGGLVTEATRALSSTRGLTRPLAPALEQLAPATRHLPLVAHRLDRLIPPTAHTVDQLDALSTEGRLPLSLLAKGTEGLPAKTQNLIPTIEDFGHRANLLDAYKGGLGQFADGWGGAFSVSDNAGIFGQIDVLGIEPLRPENAGFPPSAGSTAAGRARIKNLFAKALELTCTTNALACLFRAADPELPDEPVTDAGRGR